MVRMEIEVCVKCYKHWTLLFVVTCNYNNCQAITFFHYVITLWQDVLSSVSTDVTDDNVSLNYQGDSGFLCSRMLKMDNCGTCMTCCQ